MFIDKNFVSGERCGPWDPCVIFIVAQLNSFEQIWNNELSI